MRHTDEMTVTLAGHGTKAKSFTLPAAAMPELESFIKKAASREKLIPAEEVFPILKDDKARPGAMLRASRSMKNWTQTELAERLKIRRNHLSEMESAKRTIGKNMAKKMAKIFQCDFRRFM
jgi:ribosome-binding protein aMBF1 (putative translation factor)